MTKDEKLRKLFDNYNNLGKLSNDYAIAFIYNEEKKFSNDLHISECVTSLEKDGITNAFESISNNCFSFPDEQIFINQHQKILSKYKYVFVYSMAQNINGIGRRCLIPLLCDYYKYINISASVWASALGGNKKIMYELLASLQVSIPKTIFLKSSAEAYKEFFIQNGIKSVVLKPINESACIGVQFLDITENIDYEIKKSISLYGEIMLQEYIEGEEVAIPIIKYENNYYNLRPVCINFQNNKRHLCYEDVYYENYGFDFFTAPDEIIELTKRMAQKLDFTGVSRFDFRVQNDKWYLFDITPNPTISNFSSVNIAAKNLFHDGCDAIYKLLVFIELDKLLKPSFDRSEKK